jgi:hypothetical protein
LTVEIDIRADQPQSSTAEIDRMVCQQSATVMFDSRVRHWQSWTAEFDSRGKRVKLYITLGHDSLTADFDSSVRLNERV